MANPVGRPSEYNQETADKICELFAAGNTLTSIEKIEGMPALSTLYRWKDNYPEFAKAFARAQEKHADSLIAQTLDIADNDHDPQRARNRVGARQWLAGKLNRDKYGEKVDVSHKHTVSVTLAIDEGINRLRSISDQSDIINMQPIEISGQKVYAARDTQSDDTDIFS